MKLSKKLEYQERIKAIQEKRYQKSQLKGILVMTAIITFLIFWLSGCKSLDQKLAERIQPSEITHIRSTIEIKDTTLPRVQLTSVIDCPDFANSIPKGTKVLLGEKANVKLYASKKSNGQLMLEAIREKENIEQSKISTESKTENKVEVNLKPESEPKENWFQRNLGPYFRFFLFIFFGGLSGYFLYWLFILIRRKHNAEKQSRNLE